MLWLIAWGSTRTSSRLAAIITGQPGALPRLRRRSRANPRRVVTPRCSGARVVAPRLSSPAEVAPGGSRQEPGLGRGGTLRRTKRPAAGARVTREGSAAHRAGLQSSRPRPVETRSIEQPRNARAFTMGHSCPMARRTPAEYTLDQLPAGGAWKSRRVRRTFCDGLSAGVLFRRAAR